MTSNQLELRKARETERSNREKEKETVRSNKANERIKRHSAVSKTVTDGISAATGIAKLLGSANDPEWYNLDKQMVNDTANISFDTPLGYEIKNILGTGLNSTTNMNVNPGICVIKFIPSIGGKSQVGDISLIASKNIYAFVRHANSGSRNYEASDLMMYLYALDQAYSFHAFMRRIYSLALTAKGSNRYYINAMLKSLGIDPDSIRDNLASFRAYINSYALRVNSFYAPKNLSLYKRHYWMNTGIFKDSEIHKSQEYMFVQDAFGVYNDQDGKIEFDKGQFGPNLTNLRTFDYLTKLGNRIINGLLDSEDAGIMSGDILKAYGNGNMFYLDSTPENFHIESIYSLEVLSQITNTVLVGDMISSYDICQRTNDNKLISEIYQGEYLTQSPAAQQEPSAAVLNSNMYGMLCGISPKHTGTTNKGFILGSHPFNYSIVNMYKDNPTCDDIMVATRLTALPEEVPSTTLEPANGYRADAYNAATTNTRWGVPMKYFGTEIALIAYIITLDINDPNQMQVTFYKTINSDSSIYSATVNLLDRVSKFDWAPIVYEVKHSTSDTNNNIVTEFLGASYDGANYASVPATSLGNMHYTAVMSELGVPLLGLTVRNR